jgi:hypothetical protein
MEMVLGQPLVESIRKDRKREHGGCHRMVADGTKKVANLPENKWEQRVMIERRKKSSSPKA